MSLKLMWVALIALLTTFVSPSWASENLPTSESPAEVEWTKMRPASFAPTIESAREQCNRTAALNAHDRLTPDKCVRLEQMLRAKTCRAVSVRDGVVFDYMNGRDHGRSHITKKVEKDLNRFDPALLCDLGDRMFAYWFVGDKGKSCNNVGFVFTAAPKVAVKKVDGACGSNANRYAYTASGWPVQGSFCASGERSLPDLIFPPAGRTVVWDCLGQNGGDRAQCEASRDAVPTPQSTPDPVPRAAAPTLRCQTITERYIVPNPGQATYIPGLTIEQCNGSQALPATFVNIPGMPITVNRDLIVCQ